MAPSATPPKARTEIAGSIKEVRDNGDLQLSVGDRIQHSDYGQGVVTELRGEGARQVAQVNFDSGATKSLVVKIAPIEKL
jgi:DNA helicase-2/ATP-dependent DNA helicase PcrA